MPALAVPLLVIQVEQTGTSQVFGASQYSFGCCFAEAHVPGECQVHFGLSFVEFFAFEVTHWQGIADPGPVD